MPQPGCLSITFIGAIAVEPFDAELRSIKLAQPRAKRSIENVKNGCAKTVDGARHIDDEGQIRGGAKFT